ncbi:hypothetical protein J3R83DRAFT_8071 [Lanmaoa asiatica]|nr:hypothetical protein J3R83DRAFT_8071 [Lanmaoa asiatica]
MRPTYSPVGRPSSRADPVPDEPASEFLLPVRFLRQQSFYQVLSMSCSTSLGSRRLAERPNSLLAHSGPSLCLPEIPNYKISLNGLHLPPRPDEISDDYEVEDLDTHFRNSGNHNQEIDDTHLTPQLVPADPIPAELARLHENLESRLKLFWASSLSSRKIQVSVFLQSPDPNLHRHSLGFRPLLTREIIGTDICMHPVGMHITSNQKHIEHELLVEARIINTERMPELHETPTNFIHIPITHSIVRVISDIDDTVKVSRVVDGARAIFNQVFVKDLEDSVIPEMGEWYGTMWERGVRFHYVSNSPFELLPVINQFISISKLPLGSIRLRSYAARSLFNGLLSAPATRKRGNVIEVLEQFPESQFLLVGDSGEQDLELYSSLAAERPGQIAGVFIRDVSAVGLEDPTGIKDRFWVD